MFFIHYFIISPLPLSRHFPRNRHTRLDKEKKSAATKKAIKKLKNFENYY